MTEVENPDSPDYDNDAPKTTARWTSRSRYRSNDYRGGGSAITDILISAIGNMDSCKRVRESLALAYWPLAVGEMGAAASETERVSEGILFVRTKSSVWSHELTLHKDQILKNLNRMLGGQIIRDVVYKATRGISKRKRVVEEVPDIPPIAELNAVALEEAEREELRRELSALFSIQDERARNSIARRISLDAKLRHWRLQRGWRICLRCRSLHKTEEEICPLCRLCP